MAEKKKKKKTTSAEDMYAGPSKEEVYQARKYLGPKYDFMSDEKVVQTARDYKETLLMRDINKSKYKHQYFKDEKASGGAVNKNYAYGGRVAKMSAEKS